MKNKRLIIGLILILFLNFIVGVFPKHVQGASDIVYTAQQDIVYNSSSINYNSTFNIRNQTVIREGSATTDIYSFTDDANGGNPAGWDIYEGSGCSVNVIASLGTQTKVLELFDTNAGTTYHADAWVEYMPVDNGTIEFKARRSGITENHYYRLYTNDTLTEGFMPLSHNAANFEDVDSNILRAFTVDTWYDVKIAYDCSYDNYSLWINDVLEVDSLSMGLSVSTLSVFHIATRGWGTSSDYWFYVDDVIIISSDDINPNVEYTNTLEVANDEFNLNPSGIQYDLGAIGQGNYVNNWIVDNDPYDDITIIDSSEGFDRELKFYSDTVHFRTIEKALSITTDGFLNVSMTINYLEMNNADSNLWFGVYNGSTTEVALIRIILSGGNIELEHMNYDRGGYTNLMTLDNSVNLIRKISMLINENDTVYLRYQDNSSVDSWFSFDKVFGNVNVYNKVVFISRINDEVGTQTTHVDSMSISINGTTQDYVNDYSIYLADMNITNWNSLRNNIVEINATGIFTFGIYSDDSFSTPKGTYNYSGLKTWNVYDMPFNHSNPMLSFITNTSIVIESVLIHGVKLTEGINDYWLKFSYSNVNIDESYFYVSSNRLHHTITFDDNNTEYIQATFDIPNFNDDNYSISQYGYEFGNGYGYFGITYDDSSTIVFLMPSSASSIHYYLNYQKYIDLIEIIITDSDKFYLGTNTGYISSISFRYVPNIDLSIATISLTNAIINMIVILIPSLSIYYSFDKKKDVLLISMVLMSVVCYATAIIPLWLFFLNMICYGMFFFLKSKEGGF